MPADIKKLIEERGSLDHKIRAIVDGAENENRNLNAEEKKTFDELHTRDMDLKERIDRADRLAKREAELAEVRDHGVDRNRYPASAAGKPVGKREKITAEERALATQAWVRCQSGRGLNRRHKEAVEKYREQVDSRFNPRSGEMRYKLSSTAQFRSLQREVRAVGVSAAASTIPEGFVNNLEQALLTFGAVYQVAEIMTTATGNPLPWPTSNDTGNEGVQLNESTTFGSSVDPTFSSVLFGAWKYSSTPIFASAEAMQDSAFDLESVFGSQLGQRLARITNRKFTVGTGTNEPKGIVTAATVGVTTVSSSAIAPDEIISLQHSVDPEYRKSAAWMMNDSTLAYIRKFKSNDNQYLFQPGLQLGVPDRLLGSLLHINNHMEGVADPAETFNDAGEKVMLYGQLDKYKIRLAGPTRLRRLDERYAELDQVAFIGLLRADGNLIDAGTHPIKVLRMKP